MKLNLLVLLIAALTIIASSDPEQTTTHIDFVANSANSFSWVERTIEVTYGFRLVDDYKWHQLPDMATTIDLPFDQHVLIEYNIQLWVNTLTSKLFTKVLVDGV